MDRRQFLLKAIIESFIQTAEPVGSKFLLDTYRLDISSATIRNEMATLEKMGLLFQPHTSAGRIPTDLGFRVFVDELMELDPSLLEIKQQAILDLQAKRSEERLYEAVSLLSRSSNNISFATIPHRHQTYFLGLANILHQPEFTNSAQAYTVVKVLEDAYQFCDLLDNLEINEQIKIFIGRENIIPEIQSCSLIATRFNLPDVGTGIIGILGPTRMRYAYNIGLIEYIRDHL